MAAVICVAAPVPDYMWIICVAAPGGGEGPAGGPSSRSRWCSAVDWRQGAEVLRCRLKMEDGLLELLADASVPALLRPTDDADVSLAPLPPSPARQVGCGNKPVIATKSFYKTKFQHIGSGNCSYPSH